MEQNRKQIQGKYFVTIFNKDGKDVEFIIQGNPYEIFKRLHSFLKELHKVYGYKTTCRVSKKLKKYGKLH